LKNIWTITPSMRNKQSRPLLSSTSLSKCSNFQFTFRFQVNVKCTFGNKRMNVQWKTTKNNSTENEPYKVSCYWLS
jgi:hypothetical protein